MASCGFSGGGGAPPQQPKKRKPAIRVGIDACISCFAAVSAEDTLGDSELLGIADIFGARGFEARVVEVAGERLVLHFNGKECATPAQPRRVVSPSRVRGGRP